ncbi:MAG TPA: thioredoxin domain-containing protein [Dehalococcoidia bacterium]|nr:thioredoxin domain-containing protein [Dehalococcoidia bacterium]
MPNRLANESSPYLLQHKDNPVDWYAWNHEAFERAKREDKPVLLSVGYSACHWCHVMAHESFENPAIAEAMNQSFINIKVDREERPDVDAIYMQAVQSLTGRGGWPMTVFLTPDGRPFFGGTYYPPDDRQGMPGFPRVLNAVAEAYRNKRAEIERAGNQLQDHIRSTTTVRPGDELLTTQVLDDAFEGILAGEDREFGGFGSAPKFPQPMTLDFLLRYHKRTGKPAALDAIERTLRAMANGGMYDQVGGGFHRYSTDAVWLVPHFEKMLYDNALLARAYLDAWKVTGDPFYRRIVSETLDYVLREMTDASGGFYATQDADSEGVEGKFFLWTRAQLARVLGKDASVVGAYLGATEAGNFEASNILHVKQDAAAFTEAHDMTVEELEEILNRSKAKLYEARERRVHPGLDDKVITAWNGLMLRALAEAALALDEPRYRDAAVNNALFLLDNLRPDGRLLRSWKRTEAEPQGVARIHGYLEDYALLADGLLAVYEATFDGHYLHSAVGIVEEMLDLFWDDDVQGFYDTGRDHETLITRPRDFFDNATPSGTSVAADVLLRLGLLTDNPDYERRGAACLRAVAPYIERAPTAFGRLLAALDFHLSTPQELALIWPADSSPLPRKGEGARRAGEGSGLLTSPASAAEEAPETSPLPRKGEGGGAASAATPGEEAPHAPSSLTPLLDVVRTAYLPNLLLVGAPAGEGADITPLFVERPTLNGLPTAYLCQRYVCQAPTTDPTELRRQLALK